MQIQSGRVATITATLQNPTHSPQYGPVIHFHEARDGQEHYRREAEDKQQLLQLFTLQDSILVFVNEAQKGLRQELLRKDSRRRGGETKPSRGGG